ncbi:YheU family protein [Halioxenophilus sp. WMMB6]|uniref:YheU family protein n=1 Tax=Halioxenophilus sp. WMMB6 TaxID=3073815 RepID=UPI00295ECE48|nr:YheU family protein [Halioxenophilus sp. WMMB6]
MIIPHSQLSEEALQGIIEEFVSREGTDYGHLDYSFEEKCLQVKRQIEQGAVTIVYDEALETINLVPTEHLSEL